MKFQAFALNLVTEPAEIPKPRSCFHLLFCSQSQELKMVRQWRVLEKYFHRNPFIPLRERISHRHFHLPQAWMLLSQGFWIKGSKLFENLYLLSTLLLLAFVSQKKGGISTFGKKSYCEVKPLYQNIWAFLKQWSQVPGSFVGLLMTYMLMWALTNSCHEFTRPLVRLCLCSVLLRAPDSIASTFSELMKNVIKF